MTGKLSSSSSPRSSGSGGRRSREKGLSDHEKSSTPTAKPKTPTTTTPGSNSKNPKSNHGSPHTTLNSQEKTKTGSPQTVEDKITAQVQVEPKPDELGSGERTIRDAKASSKKRSKSKRHWRPDTFVEYDCMSERLKKTMYFANRLPATTRPSFPLTMLAVNAFTSGNLGTAQLNTLEFLDMEMASEIGRNACVSPTALIMALVYLDRLSNHNPDYLTGVKPSELFVVALLVASKFIQDDGEDQFIYNDEWANSAKMEVKQINQLEITFLQALDWRVNVSSEEFNGVLERIESSLAMDQGNSRGWYTYTELEKMTQSFLTWKAIWPTVYYYAFEVITAATLAYTTILTTLISSAILGPQIYLMSKAFLATTTVIQSGSGGGYYNFGLGDSNARCLEFNRTVNPMPISPEDTADADAETLSNLSFALEQLLADMDIELDEDPHSQSRNKSELKLPQYYNYYFHRQLANANNRKIHSHQQNVQNQDHEWKISHQEIPGRGMDPPPILSKLKAIAT